MNSSADRLVGSLYRLLRASNLTLGRLRGATRKQQRETLMAQLDDQLAAALEKVGALGEVVNGFEAQRDAQAALVASLQAAVDGQGAIDATHVAAAQAVLDGMDAVLADAADATNDATPPA